MTESKDTLKINDKSRAAKNQVIDFVGMNELKIDDFTKATIRKHTINTCKLNLFFSINNL
jgi:hypothetical protein